MSKGAETERTDTIKIRFLKRDQLRVEKDDSKAETEGKQRHRGQREKMSRDRKRSETEFVPDGKIL